MRGEFLRPALFHLDALDISSSIALPHTLTSSPDLQKKMSFANQLTFLKLIYFLEFSDESDLKKRAT